MGLSSDERADRRVIQGQERENHASIRRHHQGAVSHPHRLGRIKDIYEASFFLHRRRSALRHRAVCRGADSGAQCHRAVIDCDRACLYGFVRSIHGSAGSNMSCPAFMDGGGEVHGKQRPADAGRWSVGHDRQQGAYQLYLPIRRPASRLLRHRRRGREVQQYSVACG